MKRLNKIQNIVFITGAVLLLIGAATFFTGWLYAFYPVSYTHLTLPTKLEV